MMETKRKNDMVMNYKVLVLGDLVIHITTNFQASQLNIGKNGNIES